MRVAALALGLAGCNAILGLEPTRQPPDAAVDAPDGNAAVDAPPCTPIDDGLECTAEVCVAGLPENPPRDRGEPCAAGYCDGAGACVGCVEDAQCGLPTPGACTGPRCLDDACTIGPLAPGTYCNGGADQCDGDGSCVDCYDNGGCGECCVCQAEACVPA